MRGHAAAAIAFAVGTAGCAFLAGADEETLVVRNAAGQAITVVLSIVQDVGGIQHFGESIRLAPGEVRDYELAMEPGAHTADLTTSTRISERLRFEIPPSGDTRIEIVVTRASATLSLSTTN